VEDNHPLALEFLKRDLFNINNYFKQRGIIVFKLRDIFKNITDHEMVSEK
jgi:serine/threonine-protein kinase RIO1